MYIIHIHCVRSCVVVHLISLGAVQMARPCQRVFSGQTAARRPSARLWPSRKHDIIALGDKMRRQQAAKTRWIARIGGADLLNVTLLHDMHAICLFNAVVSNYYLYSKVVHSV